MTTAASKSAIQNTKKWESLTNMSIDMFSSKNTHTWIKHGYKLQFENHPDVMFIDMLNQLLCSAELTRSWIWTDTAFARVCLSGRKSKLATAWRWKSSALVRLGTCSQPAKRGFQSIEFCRFNPGLVIKWWDLSFLLQHRFVSFQASASLLEELMNKERLLSNAQDALRQYGRESSAAQDWSVGGSWRQLTLEVVRLPLFPLHSSWQIQANSHINESHESQAVCKTRNSME